MVQYAAEMVAARSVSAQCSQQHAKLMTDPFYVEAKGTAASFNPGGRECHFMGIAHDEDGQPIWSEDHEPVVGILATAWNTCIAEILGLCAKGKEACDRYHVKVGDLGAVISQLALAEVPYERLGKCKKAIMLQHRLIHERPIILLQQQANGEGTKEGGRDA